MNNSGHFLVVFVALLVIAEASSAYASMVLILGLIALLFLAAGEDE